MYTQTQKFRTVKENPNYLISEDGTVINRKRNKEVKSHVNVKTGYVFITLSMNGKPKAFHLHSLVLSNHGDAKPEGWCADHIDHNKTNNHIDNLRWVTYSFNLKRRRPWTKKKKKNTTTS